MQRLVVIGILAVGCGDSASTPPLPDAPAAGACDTTAPWATAPALALGATQETAAVAVDGKLHVIGGFHADRGIVPAVQIFDPVTCAWSMGPDLPEPIHHANVAAVDGTIYVVGALVTVSFTATGSVWAWTPGDAAGWTARAAMPAGEERGSSVVGVIDGKIYVAGGLRSGAVADVSVFDPAADTWTTAPALPAARDHGCGGVIGGKLYVAGGRQAVITSTTSTMFEYTPGGAWVERAPMPTARGGTACGVAGDRLIVAGGEGNPDAGSGVFPQVEAYAAATDTWATLPAMPTPRHGMGAAVIAGRLYVPGGATRQGFGAVATHEILTP